MKTVCIIQARRGSSRLPDKILKPLAGKTILAHVIERTTLIDGVDQVVCATVDDEYNKPVLAAAMDAGAETFVGSEHDVLDRYYCAARAFKADVVMRVTADCPLLDPYVCAEAVAKVTKEGVDYGATGGAWPHGMDCEIFTFDWLEEAHKNATLPEDREHVTLWMKGHKSIKKGIVDPPISGLRQANRWVIDYPDDYEFLTRLVAVAPDGILPFSWRDILALVDEHPSLRKINAHCAEQWQKMSEKILKLARDQRG